MMAGEEATQITREHVGEAGAWLGLWPRKLGPPSRGTGTEINSGRVRIHKDFPLAEALHPPHPPPPTSRLWPRESLRDSHCRTWVFAAVSQTVLLSPRLRVEGKPFVRKRHAGNQRKGPSTSLEAINPICKPTLNRHKPFTASLSSFSSSFSSSLLFLPQSPSSRLFLGPGTRGWNTCQSLDTLHTLSV